MSSSERLDDATFFYSALYESFDAFCSCFLGIIMFFKLIGATFVVSGVVEAKNAATALLRMLLAISIGTIFFWFPGYGLGFGNGNDSIIGQFVGLDNYWNWNVDASLCCVFILFIFRFFVIISVMFDGFNHSNRPSNSACENWYNDSLLDCNGCFYFPCLCKMGMASERLDRTNFRLF